MLEIFWVTVYQEIGGEGIFPDRRIKQVPSSVLGCSSKTAQMEKLILLMTTVAEVFRKLMLAYWQGTPGYVTIWWGGKKTICIQKGPGARSGIAFDNPLSDPVMKDPKLWWHTFIIPVLERYRSIFKDLSELVIKTISQTSTYTH